MRGEELLGLYEREGALLRGHFLLRSGKHAERYLQSALLLSRPPLAEKAGETLADLIREFGPRTILAPALGGIVIGHETARALGARAIFAERREDRFLLRRGFRLAPGEPVAVVEDVVTTGGSLRSVIDMAERLGAKVVAVAALVDRSEGRARIPVPFRPAATLELAVYDPASCPLCREGIPIDEPGSRGDDA
ncbi:MAG: orotate phosphoribosyltransferase [Candidatus Eisenbacteria bacterium]|nr:orotate phosphoribosyltransferase [Candidatus Eisenbacteria bacterium]